MNARAKTARACSRTSAAVPMRRWFSRRPSRSDCRPRTRRRSRSKPARVQPSWSNSPPNAMPATTRPAPRGRWGAVRSCCATRSAKASRIAKKARSPHASSAIAARGSTRIAGHACSGRPGSQATSGTCGMRRATRDRASPGISCVAFRRARAGDGHLRVVLEPKRGRIAVTLPIRNTGSRVWRRPPQLNARAHRQPHPASDGQAQARGLAPAPDFLFQMAAALVAQARCPQALDARVRTHARHRAVRSSWRSAPCTLVRPQLDLPGRAQAQRAALPDQRRLYRLPEQTWDTYESALPQAFHQHDHAGVSRRARADRGVGQSRSHALTGAGR